MPRAQFDIHIGQSPADSYVRVDGKDISHYISAVTVSCGRGGLTEVTLKGLPGSTPLHVSGAYMAVPRCDRCGHWRREEALKSAGTKELGKCPVIDDSPIFPYRAEAITTADFGCVKYRPKGLHQDPGAPA